jgi:hypothetical protein
VHGEDHPLVRDSFPDGAGEVHGLDELRPHLDPGADLLREDRIRARLLKGVELALEFLLSRTATGIPHPRGLVAASGTTPSIAGPISHARPGPRSAGVADFELGAELGDEHEARGVVLRGDLAAAGAAGASGRHLTGRTVEPFDSGGRFGGLWHLAEPIARGIVRKLFCERL